jgi:hypothetical protein
MICWFNRLAVVVVELARRQIWPLFPAFSLFSYVAPISTPQVLYAKMKNQIHIPHQKRGFQLSSELQTIHLRPNREMLFSLFYVAHDSAEIATRSY